MATYVDAGTQTLIAGLTKNPSARPSSLDSSSLLDTNTPPDDMTTEKPQLPAQIPTFQNPHIRDRAFVPSSLFNRRKNRPQLVTRISLPIAGLEADNPKSPPPSEFVLSPLPAANKLHAGHTPILPHARSPLPVEVDTTGPSTPQQDEALTGPLTLPANPGDGAEDRIELKALDSELEKIAKEQEKTIGQDDSEPSQGVEEDLPRTREASPRKPRRPSGDDVETVDGVLLKKPMMNLGAPLGQA